MNTSEKAAFLPSSDSVAVLGLGRFGRSVALSLASTGRSVLGIDHDPEVVHALHGRIDGLAVADATDLEALRRLGIDEVGRAVVAIGKDIAASALTTSLLAELEIREIWARANTRRHGLILERLGAHRVMLPQQDMGSMLAGLLGPRPTA